MVLLFHVWNLKNYWRNIFKSVLNKSVTIFNQPWIWFKTDWFRADWFLRGKMLLSPIFRAFQLIKGHTKCFSDILITIDHSTCSLWYLIQSALNQSALNQIQGRLKNVTFFIQGRFKNIPPGFQEQIVSKAHADASSTLSHSTLSRHSWFSNLFDAC